jgi:CHASE2 domain-containing sensor protein
MKLLKRLLTFVLITVITLALLGLACFGLAVFFQLVPPLGQFLAAVLVGWIAWDSSASRDGDSSTDH